MAQSLRDIDLVFIEEAFERMLLDYDRVFLSMGIPACLWRRTGEIYKGNRAFTELIGLDGHLMRDVRLLPVYPHPLLTRTLGKAMYLPTDGRGVGSKLLGGKSLRSLEIERSQNRYRNTATSHSTRAKRPF